MSDGFGTSTTTFTGSGLLQKGYWFHCGVLIIQGSWLMPMAHIAPSINLTSLNSPSCPTWFMIDTRIISSHITHLSTICNKISSLRLSTKALFSGLSCGPVPLRKAFPHFVGLRSQWITLAPPLKFSATVVRFCWCSFRIFYNSPPPLSIRDNAGRNEL